MKRAKNPHNSKTKKRGTRNTRYKPKGKVNTLLTQVADAFIDANYIMTNEVKAIMERHFGWLVCYDLSLMENMFQGSTDQAEPVKWTLYAKCREATDQEKMIYSSSVTNLLSIKLSGIEGGEYGYFAEKTFLEDEVITVYLGNPVISSEAPITHEDYPYALHVGANVNITPAYNGHQLLLGAHKANNHAFEQDPNTPKAKPRGRPRRNNAHFEGVFVIVSQRILCGNEIFVDYNLDESESD